MPTDAGNAGTAAAQEPAVGIPGFCEQTCKHLIILQISDCTMGQAQGNRLIA